VRKICLPLYLDRFTYSSKFLAYSGVKDNVEYSISVLDLSSFNVKKEKVTVKLGTAADDEV